MKEDLDDEDKEVSYNPSGRDLQKKKTCEEMVVEDDLRKLILMKVMTRNYNRW